MPYPPGPPVYPMTGSRWKTPRTPSVGVADDLNIPFQLYVTPLAMMFLFAGTSWEITTLIKTPPNVFVFSRGDIIQPDSSVALYYGVYHKEYYYKGFSSAFEGLVVFQCNANGSLPRTY